MDLATITARIPSWYRASVAATPADKVSSFYLAGPIGRGKTTVFRNAASRISKATGRNIGYVLLSGPTLNVPDTIGYLMPVHRETHTESRFSDPFFWVTQEGKRLEEYDGGIIIVDEADKMDVEVKKIIGEAALSKRLGPHSLPEGWVVWFCGNRAEDRSGSTKQLDHLINRHMVINVTDSIDSFVDFCERSGVSATTIVFAKENINIVFGSSVPEKQGPWCTPRSLVMLDSYLKSLAEENGGTVPHDSTVLEEAGGIVGPGAASQYFNFIRLEAEMPKYETIVASPEKAKVPDRPDAKMLIAYNLAHRLKAEHASKVITYVERLGKEFGVTFARAACLHDYELVLTPAFQKWSMDNASLMAAVSSR